MSASGLPPHVPVGVNTHTHSYTYAYAHTPTHTKSMFSVKRELGMDLKGREPPSMCKALGQVSIIPILVRHYDD